MLAKSPLGLEPEKKEMLTKIVKRINSVAEQLLDKRRELLSPQRESLMGIVDVEMLLRNLMIEKRFQIIDRPQIMLKADFSPHFKVYVQADEQVLTSTITNIINNAVEAIGCRGTVVVGLRTGKASCLIIINDDGPGFDKDILLKFQTEQGQIQSTKAKGSGLVLVSTREFIRTAGGDLTVQSRQGVGSMVTLSLPSTANKRTRNSETTQNG